jgi:hypothetical protein
VAAEPGENGWPRGPLAFLLRGSAQGFSLQVWGRNGVSSFSGSGRSNSPSLIGTS